MGSFNCRKCNTIPIINSSLKGFFPTTASGKSSSDCFASRCWRPWLTLHRDPLLRAPHQNQSCLFAQTLLATLPPFIWEFFVFTWITMQVSTSAMPILLWYRGKCGSSLRPFLPGQEGEHLFAAVWGEMPSCGASGFLKGDQRNLAVSLGAAGGLWGRHCHMSLWNI